MPRYRRGINQSKIERRLAEGRGQGEGAEYNPWHHIQDFPSRGRVHRIKGWLHGRVHHLFSDLELHIFLTYLWSRNVVVDIREQYPLLPLEETLAIAETLGVRHPTDPRTKHPVVLTTDFFLTIRHPLANTYEPRTAKYLDDFLQPRTLEKLEIERCYWKCRNKDLRIVTEQHLPLVLIQNVAWVRPYFWLTDLYPLSQLTVNKIASELTSKVISTDVPLKDLAAINDAQLGLKRGTSIAVVRHLIANEVWQVNMHAPIQLRAPLTLLSDPKGSLCQQKIVA